MSNSCAPRKPHAMTQPSSDRMLSSLMPCHSAYRRKIAAPITTPSATMIPNDWIGPTEPRWNRCEYGSLAATDKTGTAEQAYNTRSRALSLRCDLGTFLARAAARPDRVGGAVLCLLVATGRARRRPSTGQLAARRRSRARGVVLGMTFG